MKGLTDEVSHRELVLLRERLKDIRATVNDFNFNPGAYDELLRHYGAEPGQLYVKLRKRLQQLVGEM